MPPERQPEISMRPPSSFALLRAVNVGGRKLPMADLRTLCGGLGWENVRTYIQSGNIVFDAEGKADSLERELETAIEKEFALDVPVIVRSAAQWDKIVAANPFEEAPQNIKSPPPSWCQRLNRMSASTASDRSNGP